MPSGYSLKMRNERVVYNGAANGANERNNLGCSLFCDHKSEARRNLCDETHQCGTTFAADAVICDEARRLTHTVRHCGANRQISTFRRVVRTSATAHRKDLHA